MDAIKSAGRCACCGRALTDPQSVARSMGPVCWGKCNGDVFEADLDASDEEWARRQQLLLRGGESDLGVNWRFTDGPLQVPLPMRVSMRHKDGAFEAYGSVAFVGSEVKEIVFARGQDIRAVWREAVNAGPRCNAETERIAQANRRRATNRARRAA